jgi:hypothetical protein
MWFNPGLAGLFITSTLLHLGEDINLLIVSVVPPAAAPASVAVPTLHVDPLFIAQIVKTVIKAMLGASTLTIPIALAVQVALVRMKKADSVVTLVRVGGFVQLRIPWIRCM